MDYPIPTAVPHGADALPAIETGLRLQGAPNFRDLGGTAVAEGHVRHGQVFRSDRLAHLTPADLSALAAVDLRLVCDVRSFEERETHPNRMPEGHAAQLMHFDVSADLRATVLLVDAVRDDPT